MAHPSPAILHALVGASALKLLLKGGPQITPSIRLGALGIFVTCVLTLSCDGPRDLANTGLAYDPVNHLLFVGKVRLTINDSAFVQDSIVVKDRRNNWVDEIDISPHVDFIEGLTYVPGSQTFWVWGWEDNAPQIPSLDRVQFLALDRNGNFERSVPTPSEYASPGMIAYDAEQHGHWVKPDQVTTAGLFDSDTWELLRTLDLNVAGEGIAVSPFDGTLYATTGSYLYQFSSDGELLGTWPNPSWNDQSESVVVDPSDNTVWIGADTYFHGRLDGGNRVWHVDPHHSYNKDVFSPNMIHWTKGRVDENLFVSGDAIGMQEGQATGVWVSPVIDFESYWPEPPVLIDNLDLLTTYRYRGSYAVPTTQENHDFPLRYYDANQANQGWGDTVPSDWGATIPSTPFIQLEIVFCREEGENRIIEPVRCSIHYNDEDSPYEIEEFAVLPNVQ